MQIDFLQELNKKQKEAVTTIDGPLLILAGAGSGKTKTITTRLAYLIKAIGIPPSSTLTLTFTNKAASEMQKRALDIIGLCSHPPLLCTFHKFGLLFLKFYIHYLNRKHNFILADSDDVKRIVKELNNNLAPIALVLSEISRYKNSEITPESALKIARDAQYEHIAKVYQNYQDFLTQNNMVDFDDLLLLPLKIMQENPQIAKELSQKYQYIMVDEYQDTNQVQYKLLKLLCTTHENLCVVGDDDQSIYSWRGANIQNILQFNKHFKNTKTIKLEDNYRSTSTILNAANKLISHNKERLGKNLKSTLGDGADIKILHNHSEKEESQQLAAKIKALIDNGVNPKDIAVLFRLNALSRSLEDGFNKNGIPYILVGTIRFYERSEIKDVLSYLRILINLDDDFSLSRIINKPKRGIGKTTLDKLLQLSKTHLTSIYALFSASDSKDAHLQGIALNALGQKTYNTIKDFFNTLEDLQKDLKESSLDFLDKFEEKIGLSKALSNSDDDIDRVSNIEEFYGVYREFIKQNPLMELEDFLNDLALRSDQEDVEKRQENKGINGVSCMSVHSSKGLEFSHVFIIGLEEGLFPMSRDGTNTEEERRLGYVAFTRAKKELTLSYVDERIYRGNRSSLYPSRFLNESGVLKSDFIIKRNNNSLEFCDGFNDFSNNSDQKDEKTSEFKKGDCVIHSVLGAGRILSITQDGKEIKVKVNFGGLVRVVLSDFLKKV
ncbi:MAG: 3'-5' exonuclease [Helicobacteraceae bacterium]|nr:3'-5' exonuclease [Helicobacteraceae bacterium]